MITFELLALHLPYTEVKQSWRVSQCIIDGIAPRLPEGLGPEYQPLIELFEKCISKSASSRPRASRLKSKLKAIHKSLTSTTSSSSTLGVPEPESSASSLSEEG